MMGHADMGSRSTHPFAAGPDPVYFFESRAHGEALARLLYFAADREMGMAAITGEIGAGKTMTLQVMAHRLPPDAYRTIQVFTAPESSEGILIEINRQLGGDHHEETTHQADALRQSFNRLLQRKIVATGRHLLVMVDEAQGMSARSLDMIKSLTNPVDTGRPHVSIVLSGQPELKATLRTLPQVYQRMGLVYHLGYLDREEVPSYVGHRLAVAQASAPVSFDADAFDVLHAFSKGCPRQINRVCKLAVDRAHALQQPAVDASMLAMIIRDFEKHFD